MAVGGVSAGADTLVTKKPVTAGGTSETAVAAGGAAGSGQVKSTEGTGDKGLTAAEDKEFKNLLNSSTDKKDDANEVAQNKGVDVNKLSDEERKKLAEEIAAKIKQKFDVEGLSKEGQAQKGTCCGGTTQQQAADATNEANNKLQNAYQNYITAKQNKETADANVEIAERELANARNQKITNADGTQTQDENAINQAEAKRDQALKQQEDAKKKLAEAEKALIKAEQEANAAKSNQTDISNKISSAQRSYQDTYNAMLASGSTGGNFSLAA